MDTINDNNASPRQTIVLKTLSVLPIICRPYGTDGGSFKIRRELAMQN